MIMHFHEYYPLSLFSQTRFVFKDTDMLLKLAAARMQPVANQAIPLKASCLNKGFLRVNSVVNLAIPSAVSCR